MERKQIVHNAYAVVGQLSKGYDGMMKNESLLGRLANRFFWQLSGSRYESFVLTMASVGMEHRHHGIDYYDVDGRSGETLG